MAIALSSVRAHVLCAAGKPEQKHLQTALLDWKKRHRSADGQKDPHISESEGPVLMIWLEPRKENEICLD